MAQSKSLFNFISLTGFLCRDISPDGFRFYVNIFTDITPNDLYL